MLLGTDGAVSAVSASHRPSIASQSSTLGRRHHLSSLPVSRPGTSASGNLSASGGAAYPTREPDHRALTGGQHVNVLVSCDFAI